jgi:uncharacterized protein involved in response to NO
MPDTTQSEREVLAGEVRWSDDVQEMVRRERLKSLVLRAWIVAGLFFMALPGTLLGFSNLLAISTHHGSAFLPAAWMQGHGHAQVFGWIGSFVLGIGFYSQPARGKNVHTVPVTCFVLWVSGVAMRWLANIYSWHWQTLLVISASLELIAVLLFLSAASRHKKPAQTHGQGKRARMELWMVAVLLGTAGLTASIVFNFVECLKLAANGTNAAFPFAVDQRFLILIAWGFLVPTVWGFSARWLPTFLAIPRPNTRAFALALMLDVDGVLFGVAGWTRSATILLAVGAAIIVVALHLFEKPQGNAKVQGIHPSFPIFVRLVYVWLMIAGGMGIWAAFADVHGGIWGASRHALTVGFAATMVFSIGPRILPHFGGIYSIYSKRLMFVCLVLLQAGCTVRVLSEPLAYEGYLSFAWKTLPYSGMLELSAVLVFAANLVLTFALGHPALAPAKPHQSAA